jgi:hypothetical protein
MAFRVPEQYRILGEGQGNNGMFTFASPIKPNELIRCIASDGGKPPWEHVSVTVNKKRCPVWEEMCYVKSIFWEEEDAVVQFHPPKSEYIDNHKYCLHLWRPVGFQFQRPPKIYVGV